MPYRSRFSNGSTWPRFGSLLFLVCSAALAGRAGASLTSAERARLRAAVVGDDVIEAFDHQQRVPVMVVFSTSGSPDLTMERSITARRRGGRALRERVLRSVEPGQVNVTHELDSIATFAGTISMRGLVELSSQPEVERIDIDLGGSAELKEAVPLVHLDVLHALGFTGKGVTVGLIDTGVDTQHPDLADSLVAQHCICGGGNTTGCCPDGSSEQDGPGSAEDDNGHGTNVAGIITSNGAIAPTGGAPDAQIVVVKALDRNAAFQFTSDVIASLDWIAANRPDVDIVNMSLGTFVLYMGDCDGADARTMAFARSIDALTAQGVLVVASSGNQSSGVSMPAPACVHNSFSVGAVWDSNVGPKTVLGCIDTSTRADQVTCFSNSDPSTDVFAPGAPITSTGIRGGTSTYYGTSQASPMAAACAAALLQADPGLPPAELEQTLKVSTTLVTDPKNGLSFPRIDCEQSLAALGKLSPTPSPSPSSSVTPTGTITPTDTIAPTPTPTITPTASAVMEPTSTAPPTVGEPACVGDCNGDGSVSIDELVIEVSIMLGTRPTDGCAQLNVDHITVTVDVLLAAIQNALTQCPAAVSFIPR